MRGNPVRKTIIYGAAGATVVVAALLVVALVATQDASNWPADGVGTFLWAIHGETADGIRGTALGIVAFDPAGIVLLSIPSDVCVKGRDGRLIEVGSLGEMQGWKSCCDAVGLLLGIDVAGYAVAESADVALFCDEVGPIVVDCAAPVSYRESAKDAVAVDIARGRQELGGREALAYVMGVSTEPTAERWEQVVRGALAAATGPRFAAVGASLRLATNLDRGKLRQVWETFSRPGASVTLRAVPTAVVVRDGIARRVAKAVEMEALMASLVRSENPLTPEDVSVAVFNGSGVRLAATRAAVYLEARGFRVPRVGNADAFDYTLTTIVRLTDEARAWILREALPGTARISTPAELGARYEALRPLIPPGTDLALVVGAGMEWNP